MATHYGILAWRIPWMEEPGGLYRPWGRRVGHDWATNTLTTFNFRVKRGQGALKSMMPHA